MGGGAEGDVCVCVCVCVCHVPIIVQRIDRAWCDFDGGYDDTNNPFANIPEEYTRKKEEKLTKTTVKRMSAQQQQINKVKKSGALSLLSCVLMFYS